jgi:phage/plasmid primase-like uncharacterized protein
MDTPPVRHVDTDEIKAAVIGSETDVLDALDINWKKPGQHIDCPYPGHGGKNDWRWDSKMKRAVCTCNGGKYHSIFDVVKFAEEIDFKSAKVRIAEIIGRDDLIHEQSEAGSTTAYSLLNRPLDERDDTLPAKYLSHRLGVDVADILMPSTPAVGLKQHSYYDPPPTDTDKFVLVGKFPCAVFRTESADGKYHALRIYVASDGAGKANLGADRNPKKSAKKLDGDNTTAGRCVLWGNAEAEHMIVSEGIETASAIAYAFKAEVATGNMLVAAAISASGIQALEPWPSTKRITIAADRDEAVKNLKPASHTGEKAAIALASRVFDAMPVSIALPGNAGTTTDWLNILTTKGIDAVRSGILGAPPFHPGSLPSGGSGGSGGGCNEGNGSKNLKVGSDVEIAQTMAKELQVSFSQVSASSTSVSASPPRKLICS